MCDCSPKVFLRIFPSVTRKVESYYGLIGLESQKVISFLEAKSADTVYYCLYNQVFSGLTHQKYIINSFCLDEVCHFINGGSSILFFQDEIKFQNHTMLGKPDDPGVVPRALALIFSTLEDSLPEECEFKLSKNLGKIFHLTEEDKESENAIRNEIFDETSCCSDSSHIPCEKLDIDCGKNYIWVSSFVIFDNKVYDLLEAVSEDGPALVSNWRNRISTEFPLSYLCKNVHVRTKPEALQLFLEAKSNFEECLFQNHFDPERAVFIYCLTNLRHRKEKSYGKVTTNTLSFVSFPGMENKPYNPEDKYSGYIAALTALSYQMKRRANFKTPVPLKKDNLLKNFFKNLWVGNKEISMIINLCLDQNKYQEIVKFLRRTCLKELAVYGVNMKEIQPITTHKQPKMPRKRMYKEDLADDARLKLSLKWNEIKKQLKCDFKEEELISKNILLANENPFLVVDFMSDRDYQTRLTFPWLHPLIEKTFETEVAEIKSLKVNVMILKYLESIFMELIEEFKAEYDVSKKVCSKVKKQLRIAGKLDAAEKVHVLSVFQKKIDSIIVGPMSFQTLEELVYLQEIVNNDFRYI